MVETAPASARQDSADAADEALNGWLRRNGALELGDGRAWAP